MASRLEIQTIYSQSGGCDKNILNNTIYIFRIQGVLYHEMLGKYLQVLVIITVHYIVGIMHWGKMIMYSLQTQEMTYNYQYKITIHTKQPSQIMLLNAKRGQAPLPAQTKLKLTLQFKLELKFASLFVCFKQKQRFIYFACRGKQPHSFCQLFVV